MTAKVALMLVSILQQGDYLVVSIHSALNDSELLRLQKELLERIGEHRSRGVIPHAL